MSSFPNVLSSVVFNNTLHTSVTFFVLLFLYLLGITVEVTRTEACLNLWCYFHVSLAMYFILAIDSRGVALSGDVNKYFLRLTEKKTKISKFSYKKKNNFSKVTPRGVVQKPEGKKMVQSVN
uniref:Uncharacterized protein n=1 Tax=Cacopsylla melanoneura TaxID=428564 RepID=A0A8D8UYG4_9HEMI